MATSVLDYIFRELAISYLDRTDLANVDPHELHHDSLGKGAKEQDLGRGDAAKAAIARLTSAGYVRGNLRLLKGGARSEPPLALTARAGGGGAATGLAAGQAVVRDDRTVQAQMARLKGYEGDPCGNCGNFTLVRSGTCLKCDTCGSTTGCS